MTASARARADRRTIDLDGVWNMRDLGGLPTRAMGQVWCGRLYRSGSLWFASNADCAVLAALHLDTVIDLRTEQEAQHEEDWLCEILDLRYIQLPIHVPAVDSASEHGGMADPGSGERYQRLLEHNIESYIRALEIVSRPDRHPVLFHCAAGKDRTGLLAALALTCLDVEQSAIVADYAESDASIHHIIDRYRGDPVYGRSSAAVPAGYRVDARAMDRFLNLMGGGPGLRRWVLDHGLDESALRRMREALTEPTRKDEKCNPPTVKARQQS
jgi:protein-tyrosine phosphatase